MRVQVQVRSWRAPLAMFAATSASRMLRPRIQAVPSAPALVGMTTCWVAHLQNEKKKKKRCDVCALASPTLREEADG